MVGPIWVYKIDKEMGKPQSKVEIQENIINNGNAKNEKFMIPEYVMTLVIVALVLYIAHKINSYFKNYVQKHKDRISTNNAITDV